MRHISLREFRTRGAKALEAVPASETILLSGQDGPAYFLVPVSGDVIAEERELRLARARASLLHGWKLAEAFPITDEEIDAEIAAYRAEREELRRG